MSILLKASLHTLHLMSLKTDIKLDNFTYYLHSLSQKFAGNRRYISKEVVENTYFY